MAETNGKINFDLDSVEDGPGPYVFTVQGERFETRDPASLDWKVLASIDPRDHFQVLQTVFEESEYQRFCKLVIPGRKLSVLMDKLVDHYQLQGTKRGNLYGSRI